MPMASAVAARAALRIRRGKEIFTLLSETGEGGEARQVQTRRDAGPGPATLQTFPGVYAETPREPGTRNSGDSDDDGHGVTSPVTHPPSDPQAREGLPRVNRFPPGTAPPPMATPEAGRDGCSRRRDAAPLPPFPPGNIRQVVGLWRAPSAKPPGSSSAWNSPKRARGRRSASRRLRQLPAGATATS